LPHGAAPNWVLGNHDKPRIASRVGQERARLAAMLLLTLRGTPTLYYGDEIGLTDVPIPPDEVQDPFEKNEPGKGLGRDPQRTPMQWSRAHGAGFTDGTPWLRLGGDWGMRNVEAQQGDPASMLQLYKKLIALRRNEPALHEGSHEQLDAGADVLAYARSAGTRRLVVLLNFATSETPVAAELLPADTVALASTHADRTGAVKGELVLQPLEGVIVAQ
jgi:alpha-glucosidase